MIKIALLDDYQDAGRRCAEWSRLPQDAQVQAFHDHLVDQQALAQRLAPFDVVMALRERTSFPAALLERLPNLKLLATAGPRNASIDVAACTRLGILVCHTGAATQATAELTWALILAVVRHLPQEHAALRQGRWQSTVGMGLEGKTLGLLGLGHIGGQMARIALGFGMQVAAWSQNLTDEHAREAGARRVSLEQLLEQSDVLSIHTRLSERTQGLLGAAELARMKPTAYLVNSSRGPIVQEQALLEALRQHRIAGAALDTYDVEPLPAGHPLLSLDNVVLTPHLGYVTWEVYAGFYAQTLENIQAFLAGQPKRVLNPEVLPKRRLP